MRKTIEAMYYDNLSISGRSLNKNGEYYKTEREVCDAAVKLEDYVISCIQIAGKGKIVVTEIRKVFSQDNYGP